MSSEYYFYCKGCGKKVHFGTRYAGGFRMFTIGANQEETTEWFNEHVFCRPLYIVDEHFDEEDNIPEPQYAKGL